MWNVPVKLAQSEIQNERKNKYRTSCVPCVLIARIDACPVLFKSMMSPMTQICTSLDLTCNVRIFCYLRIQSRIARNNDMRSR